MDDILGFRMVELTYLGFKVSRSGCNFSSKKSMTEQGLACPYPPPALLWTLNEGDRETKLFLSIK